ncbi:hypothetical protein [Caldalkalibacillus mannanilyticus]|uniref:hypothetical protein n=1 Tax=Caldalkalibacillus mannanilyticus TaxID=1418 RepID=UPI00046A5265|nr:hypothetical protein [Caldalkalibacillus mannanilyticus]
MNIKELFIVKKEQKNFKKLLGIFISLLFFAFWWIIMLISSSLGRFITGEINNDSFELYMINFYLIAIVLSLIIFLIVVPRFAKKIFRNRLYRLS